MPVVSQSRSKWQLSVTRAQNELSIFMSIAPHLAILVKYNIQVKKVKPLYLLSSVPIVTQQLTHCSFETCWLTCSCLSFNVPCLSGGNCLCSSSVCNKTSFFWFCRTWTKRYLITSQTRVKRVSRIHHRTIQKILFGLAARKRLSLSLPLSFSPSSYFLSFSIQKNENVFILIIQCHSCLSSKFTW